MLKKDWSDLGLGILGLVLTLSYLARVKMWAMLWKGTAFAIKSRRNVLAIVLFSGSLWFYRSSSFHLLHWRQ